MSPSVPKPTRKLKEKILKPKVRVAIESNPLEYMEQEAVAQWLDLYKVFYTATIAGAFLHPATFNRIKKMGLKTGVSDIIIFDPPPAYDRIFIGMCLEMKRRKNGMATKEQLGWLNKMHQRKWLTYVANGADEAINMLEIAGYGGVKP